MAPCCGTTCLPGASTAAMLLLALLAVCLLPERAAAHGFLARPAARNVVRNWQYCPHCANGGGPGASSNDGALTWPDSSAPVCGSTDLANAGAVIQTYAPGAVIKLTLFITAQHGGRHVFRLCPSPDVTKGCLTQYTLTRADGSGPYSWTKTGGGPVPGAEYGQATRNGLFGEVFTFRYKLPAGVTCDRCVLQWWWTTANSCRVPGAPDYVGSDSGMLMCTQQGPFPEEFFNCADVAIAPGGTDASSAPWYPWPQYPISPDQQANLDSGAINTEYNPIPQQQQPQPQPGQGQAGGDGGSGDGSGSGAGGSAGAGSDSGQPQPSGDVTQMPAGLPQAVQDAVAALEGKVIEPWATYICQTRGFAEQSTGAVYYPVLRNCAAFVICSPEQGWIKLCPNGLLWDSSQQVCNRAESTDCHGRPIPAPGN